MDGDARKGLRFLLDSPFPFHLFGTAVDELRGGHGGQVEIFEALGVTGDDEVSSRLEGGEILHGILQSLWHGT